MSKSIKITKKIMQSKRFAWWRTNVQLNNKHNSSFEENPKQNKQKQYNFELWDFPFLFHFCS